MKTNETISATPKFDREELREAIRSEYKEVACNPNHTIHFTSGKKLAKKLEYQIDIIEQMPENAVRAFAGVGNPHQMGRPLSGQTIVDIGSGAGFDSIYSAKTTPTTTKIYGVDMTEEMVDSAVRNAAAAGCANIEYLKGYAEQLPFAPQSVDIVMSNGVINLCPDKRQVYREIFRVLKPGGRFMVADVLLDIAVPESSRELIHLWTNCVAGAVNQNEYLDIIKSAGFGWVEFGKQFDVFKDARIAKSAAYFGAKGQHILGIKIK